MKENDLLNSLTNLAGCTCSIEGNKIAENFQRMYATVQKKSCVGYIKTTSLLYEREEVTITTYQ